MRKIFKAYGIAFIIVAIYAFIKLPVLRLDFTSGFTTLILFFVLAGILDMMLDRGDRASKMAKNNFLLREPAKTGLPVFHNSCSVFSAFLPGFLS